MSSNAEKLAARLKKRNTKVVFAESCTAGLVAATLGQIPGISDHLCGSAVTYSPDLKKRWLGVRKKTILAHTTESPETAREMAKGILKNCPEANWGVSVVGHFGPDAPVEKDGTIFVAILRRNKKGKIKLKEEFGAKLKETTRSKRQTEAVDVIMKHLYGALKKKGDKEEPVQTPRNRQRRQVEK